LRDRPASVAELARLGHLDDVGLALLGLVLLWGFGLRAGTLAVLIIGLGFPWITLWTGGSVGRSVWLLATLTGLAAGQRGWVRLAGASLGVAAALQIFPALLLAGAVAGLLVDRWQGRPSPPERRPWLFAALAAGLVLVLLSALNPGASLWPDFIRNSFKHLAGSSSNRIGVAQVVAVWRLPTWCGWAVMLGGIALWVRAARRRANDRERTLLALALPLFVTNLSSYYLALLAGAAPRLASSSRAAFALMVLVVLPQAAAYLEPGVPDQAYYAKVSLLFVVAAMVWLWAESQPKPSPPGFA
jgi:hypothetical protein